MPMTIYLEDSPREGGEGELTVLNRGGNMREKNLMRLLVIAFAVVALAGWVREQPARWAYRCTVRPDNQVVDMLDQAGNAGWEMVGFARETGSRTTFCFKRPR
jgi:hypothetical protein